MVEGRTGSTGAEDYQERLQSELYATCIETVAELLGQDRGETKTDQRAWAREELEITDVQVRRQMRVVWGTLPNDQAAFRAITTAYFEAIAGLHKPSVPKFLALLPYTEFPIEDQLALADACRAAHRLDSVIGAYDEVGEAQQVVATILNQRSTEPHEADQRFDGGQTL